MLSILAFTLSVVLDYLVFRGDNLTVKGGPNSGPRRTGRPSLFVWIHYEKTELCRVFQVHDKGQKMHNKAFVVRFSQKRTTKAAQQHFAH
jgi:hypothetical protein